MDDRRQTIWWTCGPLQGMQEDPAREPGQLRARRGPDMTVFPALAQRLPRSFAWNKDFGRYDWNDGTGLESFAWWRTAQLGLHTR
jgi:hypothetical protein